MSDGNSGNINNNSNRNSVFSFVQTLTLGEIFIPPSVKDWEEGVVLYAPLDDYNDMYLVSEGEYLLRSNEEIIIEEGIGLVFGAINLTSTGNIIVPRIIGSPFEGKIMITAKINFNGLLSKNITIAHVINIKSDCLNQLSIGYKSISNKP